jgi:GT2 family glycosyltransferase
VSDRPALSVVIPTFNNVKVLERCLESWRAHADGLPIELIVIEDGCRDETPDMLARLSRTPWGGGHLRWFHQDDAHELRCTNFGLKQARAPLAMSWHDDMFLEAPWLVTELLATFEAFDDLGILCLSRGLNCVPYDEPIVRWEDLIDWRRLQSTIGPRPLNWFVLHEVDIVIRPWIVRRACLDVVGVLDEAFVPTEWDEADLCLRIREAGWKVATHGYERDGAYTHLGNTTLVLSDAHKARALRNGLLFHERWDTVIERDAGRPRRRWWRRSTPTGWYWTARQLTRMAFGHVPRHSATVQTSRAANEL